MPTRRDVRSYAHVYLVFNGVNMKQKNRNL